MNGYYNYGYTTTSDAAGAGLAIGLLLFYIFFCLAIVAFDVIVMWKTFKKAGKNGWEAIIPFYNMWTLFEISGYPGFYSLAILIPCVGGILYLVVSIMAMISLAKKFGKSDGFGILLALLPIIGFAILAFSKDVTYDATLGEHKNQQAA